MPSNGNAFVGTRGVRPAMFIRGDLTFTGDGTAASPYTVTDLPPAGGGDDGTPPPVDETGHDTGIFALVRNSDLSTDAAQRLAASPDVDGITYYTGVSVPWPTPDTYNFDYLDEIIYLCRRYRKPLKVALLGGQWIPAWFYDAGVQKFQWSLEGDPIAGDYDATAEPPWDPTYLSLMQQLLGVVSARYGDNPTIVSWQVTGPALASGLETNLVLIDQDVVRIGYDPATYTAAWKTMIDAYGKAFPTKEISLALNNQITMERDDDIPRELRDYAAGRLGDRFRAEILYVTDEDWFSATNDAVEIWCEAANRIRLEGQLIQIYSAAAGATPDGAYQAVRNAASLGARMVEVYSQDLLTDAYAQRIADARSEFLVNRAPARVSTSTSALTLDAGASTQVTALVLDGNGYPISGTPVGWSSTKPSVATVDGQGTVAAQRIGQTTVTASHSGVPSGTVAVTVLADAKLVPVPGQVTIVRTGITRQLRVLLTAVAYARDITAQAGYQVADTGIATVDATGHLVAAGAGSTTVTIDYQGLHTTVEVRVLGIGQK